MKSIIFEKIIENINPLQIQKYLKSTGWNFIQSKRPQIGIYFLNKGAEWFEVTLPLKKEYADFEQAIKIIIERIAEVEKKEFKDVLNRLVLPVSDIVKFRVVNSETEYGTISFDDGFNLLQNAKKTLYTTACDYIKPELYHQRLSFKKANDFINNCRLGQTEHGSFIGSVICPFIKENDSDIVEQLSLFDTEENFQESLTRKVTEKLMISLTQLKSLIETDQLQQLEDQEVPVMSGNFIESLISLSLPSKESTIEVITDWAPTVPIVNSYIPIKFSKDHIIPAERWVKKIREKAGRKGVFVGRISQVKTNPDITKRKVAEFMLNFLDEQNKKNTAKVVIPSDDLSLAIEAIQDGKYVKVSGVLEGKKKKEIKNPEIDSVS
ncbi:MAG: hypothetical protein COX07_03265 [Bacteroidetes bacterium CG23_combo_of_CG06-09_8_20_14_all_32_9]|nr:MAG: hypothetical protein COX07_03265 [Bacteroidetes bacterium CG23_combo_of_CG06-09_8_20_14_all_32_9]